VGCPPERSVHAPSRFLEPLGHKNAASDLTKGKKMHGKNGVLYSNIPARFSLQLRWYVAMTTPFFSHFCTL